MKKPATLVTGAWFLLAVATLWGIQQGLEATMNPYFLRVLISTGIAMILALSLNLIHGCAGQFSLGQAGFMAVGAYVSATLTTVLPAPWTWHGIGGVGGAILVGGAAAALSGYLVGLPSLRLRGDYLAIVTLGFGEIIRIVLLNIDQVGGPRGLPGVPTVVRFSWVYAWVLLTLILLLRLMRSSSGRAILSVREDELAAGSMGIAVSYYKVLAFTVSAFFAGIAGGLFAHYQGFIDPNGFNFAKSVEVVIMVVLGGMGSFSGAMTGAVLVTVLPEVLRVFDRYRLVIFPLILIGVMLFRPSGIFGYGEIWKTRWWKRLFGMLGLASPLDNAPPGKSVKDGGAPHG